MSTTPEQRLINGRYALLREIGRGGMATIWEAHDALLDRRVALKLLHPQFARDPEFLERFHREARSAAALAHPNVVALYDVGEDGADGTPFLVMELIEGQSLKDRIRTAAPLPDADVRRLGAEVALALDYAHERGLIHRDVKPQNILLGRDGRARLTDFGIAQALNASALTRTGAVMGSVHYLAPELARGQRVTPAADVYGLGVVLYEMATGRVPFLADTDMAVALAHVEQPPPPPREFNRTLAPDLEATILQALAKRPAERFPTGGALALALHSPAVAAQPTTVIRPAATVPGERTMAIPRGAPQRRAAPPVSAPAVGAPAARRRVAPPPRSGGGAGLLGWALGLAAVLAALGIGFFGLASVNRGGSPTPTPAATPSTPALAVPSPSATRPATATATGTPAPSATAAPTATATPTASATPTATPPPATATPAPTARPPTAAPTRGPVPVPNVVGRPRNEAEAALRQAGAQVAVKEVNANAPAGQVVAQTPDAGAPLPRDGRVTLSIATGEVTIPEVEGKREAEATTLLERAGLRVPSVRRERSARVPEGGATRTDPPAGKSVPRGTQVDLYVSVGR